MNPPPVAFLLSAPRSGSSLLLRMLNAHPELQGLAEPHLVHPLQALQPESHRPVGTRQSRRGLAVFLRGLPQGQSSQHQAFRAYLDTLYSAALENAPTGTRHLIDKTPANASAVRFIRELYPQSPLLILRRHPAAIAWSHARTFFGGDLKLARRKRPILTETIPALAPVLRGELGPHKSVDYEQLVTQPVPTLRALFELLDVPDCPEAVHYGRVPLTGIGDPVEVDRHTHPVPTLADAWKGVFKARAEFRAEVEEQLAAISDADLDAWGWPRDRIWIPLEGDSPPPSSSRPTRYTLSRRALIWARRDIRRRPHGRVVLKVRDLCDLLLDSHEQP